jgi:spermidine/putrescine transport system ATP-binding protein
MTKAAVELQDISKSYGSVAVLDRMSLAVGKAEYVVLLGPSGSGKTTLLSIIGGFCEPSTGRIIIGGVDVTDLSPAHRPTVTVFQDYALFPHMTVRQNTAFGLSMRRVPERERIAQAEKALEIVGLAGFGDRKVHQISGGQRQRVALARAIVIKPAVLLLDEPLGALDVKIRRQMQDELRQLQRALGATFIHVTHDQEEAMSIADTVLLLNKGRIEDVGPPERIYKKPASLFAATFMGEANLVRGRISRAVNGCVSVETPFGQIPAIGAGEVGRHVHISIRPESIRTGNPPDGSGVSLGMAKLSEFVFQGTHKRCRAAIGEKADGRLMLRLPADSDLTADSSAILWVPAADVTLIHDDTAQR